MNSDNSQQSSPLNTPSSPRDRTPSPKIVIPQSFPTYAIFETSDKVAYSYSRERAPSLLAQRLEEEARLEQERYKTAFADEVANNRCDSPVSNQSVHSDHVASHDEDVLLFECESNRNDDLSAQPDPYLIYIAQAMQNSNHPAFLKLNFYDTLLLLQQHKQAIHEELHTYFKNTGPRR
jgi:hypothetical protein